MVPAAPSIAGRLRLAIRLVPSQSSEGNKSRRHWLGARLDLGDHQRVARQSSSPTSAWCAMLVPSRTPYGTDEADAAAVSRLTGFPRGVAKQPH